MSRVVVGDVASDSSASDTVQVDSSRGEPGDRLPCEGNGIFGNNDVAPSGDGDSIRRRSADGKIR